MAARPRRRSSRSWKPCLTASKAWSRRVRELQNDDIQDARDAYIAQSGGYGNEDTFGEAIGYGKQTETNRRKELGQRRDEAKQAYLASIAAMQENGASQAEMDAAYEAYLAREQAFNDEEAAILAERDEIFANSWAGLAKREGDGAEVLAEIAEMLSFAQLLQDASDKGEFTDEDILKIFTPENLEKYFDGYPGVQEISPEELLDMGRRFGIPNSMYYGDIAWQWLNGLGSRLSASGG